MIRNFVRIMTVLCALGLFAGVTFAQTSADQSSPSTSKMSKKSSNMKSRSKKVDINSASKEDLVAAGLDEATAQKVIDGRPYTSKRALLNKHILTKDEYNKVSGNIVAHRAKKKAAKM
ncbi:MAG TPA: helix-hairpin-helix domain-containing protein [Candidatus Angelobacter sp.]|nr:helix-hairpin-helix domain-containing protein [Candidatus Angelobacter sp.]